MIHENLVTACVVGGGYYFNRLICPEMSEYSSLRWYLQKNRSMVKTIAAQTPKLSIFQLTPEYFYFKGVPIPKYVAFNEDRKSVVGLLLRSAYAIELQSVDAVESEKLVFDDFKTTDFSSSEALLVTTKVRSKVVNAKEIAVPNVFNDPKVAAGIDAFLEAEKQSGGVGMPISDAERDLGFGFKQFDWVDNLLQGGIFPTSHADLHTDRRAYPGHGKKITGREKWHVDCGQMAGECIKTGYLLGVWPPDWTQASKG